MDKLTIEEEIEMTDNLSDEEILIEFFKSAIALMEESLNRMRTKYPHLLSDEPNKDSADTASSRTKRKCEMRQIQLKRAKDRGKSQEYEHGYEDAYEDGYEKGKNDQADAEQYGQR